ncbi:MAG: hypothetical protein KatS3mg027_0598 [Bacteroidia bacterium]|nr:MAG: hypothetical protein KatS3mg027_0598 [Bacteroidia bacterium]
MEIDKIQKLPIHFIFCTERSGSSLLNTILNQSPEILATSEELFALYLYPKYHKKISYTEKEIKTLVREFVYVSEKNLKMFFSDIKVFEENLMKHKEHLPYSFLVRLIYFHFFDLKDKLQLKLIVDKQIKFLYYIEDVLKIFPDSKYIILVRDVRDNVLIRKSRNLDNTSDVVYMAGIWNDTYKNVEYLFDKISKDKILVIHYEDLMKSTAEVIRKTCHFLEVNYFPEMLNYQETYRKFIELKRPLVGEEYYKRTLDFHSGLLKPISTEKIGIWKKELTPLQLQKIATICGKTASYLGYDLSENGTTSLTFNDKFQLLKARLKRYWFLKFYLKLPLGLKVFIKKVRGKNTMDV